VIHLPEAISAAAAVMMFILGARIIIKSPEAPGKSLFSAACFCSGGVSAAALVMISSFRPQTVLLAMSILMVFSFISTALIVSYFSRMGKGSYSGRDRAVITAFIGAGLILSAFTISAPARLFVSRIHFMRDAGGILWGFTVSGWGKTGAAILLFSNVFVLHRIENIFRSANIPGRVTLKYPLLGVIIASLINFTVFSRLIAVSILNRNHFAVLGCGTIILAVTWLYAFIRYQPLQITIKSFKPVSSFSVTMTGLYLISLSIISYISSILNVSFDSFTVLLFALFGAFLVLSIAISGKTRRRIRRFVSDNFQADRYNYRKEWNRYSRIMNERNSVNDLLQNTIGSICESMLVGRGCICITQAGSGLSHYGEPPSERCVRILLEYASGSADSESIEFFNGTAVKTYLRNHSDAADFSDTEWIRALSVLKNPDRALGVIALGEKDTGAKFVEEDRNFLSTVSEELALALENLILSERIMESDRIESFNRFASFVIHDLKNTLGMLSLTAENARENIGDPNFQKDAVDVLRRAVEKINRLISSLSAHKSPPAISRESIDIGRFLREQADMLEEITAAKDIELDIKAEGELPAMADPEALKKIMENLVLNSVEASPPRTLIRIISGRTEDNRINITVSDRGEGFQPEYFNNDLFKPFRSTKKNGLGIGLVMCKSLAEAHNGTIIIEGSSREGASVTLTIPGLDLRE